MGALAEAAAQAPPGPAVYAFLAGDGELLYVGKAGDLRRRLRQHAAGPAPSPRLARLYIQVREVRWEPQPDAPSALAREADLIVGLLPRYNASIRAEGRWRFVVLTPLGGGAIRLEQSRTARGARSYGSFPHLGPGGGSRPATESTEGYAALLRLIWAASGRPGHCPAALSAPSAPARVELALDETLAPRLHALLSGTSARLLADLAAGASRREAYLQPALRRDGAAAEGFFRAGPAALRALRLRHGRPPGPMSRPEIRRLLAEDLRRSIGEFRIPPLAPEDELLGRGARAWAR